MLRSSFAVLLLCSSTAAGEPGPVPGGNWPVEAGEAAGYPYDVHYGGYPPGGYEGRIGKPYFWSVPGGTAPLGSFGTAGGVSDGHGAAAAGPVAGAAGCGCNKNASAAGHVGSPSGLSIPPGPTGAVAASGPAGDPYSHHFGPGFYRSGEFGHYRFPYYSYRRPWYDVGHPVRVRDTNLAW